MRKAICNGKIINEDEAVLPITKRAVQYSYSIYEALRITDSHIVHFEDHYERLKESADAIKLNLHYSYDEFKSALALLIEEENISNATVRILVVGGDVDKYYITYTDLLSYPESYYEDGVAAEIYFGERFLPTAKTSNLLMSYIALEEAKFKGAFESLLVNRNGVITEGTRSNFYAILDGKVYTAPDELVLGGITRISVIKAIEMLGLEIIYEPVRYDELKFYDSVFISSTSMAALPLNRVGEDTMNKKSWPLILKIRDLVRSWE